MKLLIDWGASRIKSALTDGNKLYQVKSYEAIPPCNTKDHKYEISSTELHNKFRHIVDDYLKESNIEGILICSEMHGFIIVDEEYKPLTNYISWKDQRYLNNSNFNGSYVEGYIDNIYSALSEYNIDNALVLSLPEFLCNISNKAARINHETMATSIFNNDKIKFNDITSGLLTGGYYEIIPICVGIGDHQCSILGAGNNENTISFNLGTGSQISIINKEIISCATEERPYFNNQKLICITHIPSGRAFNEYLGFLNELVTFSDGLILRSYQVSCDFWTYLSKLTLKDLDDSTLIFDLAIFNSAFNFNGNSGISNILEGSLNLKNYLASLVKSYANQYIELLSEFEPLKSDYKIILSGGISRKIPVLKEYFEQKTGYKVEVSEQEETLLGLIILSKEWKYNEI